MQHANPPLPLFEPERIPLELDEMGTVDETVQDSRNQVSDDHLVVGDVL